MNQLKEKIIAALKKSAADLVCFGSADRMRDPAVKKLFPEAKTVICVAFRQLRGTRRGIEEGTVYYQYTTSVETVEEVMIPGALLRGCSVLEEAGFEALPQRRFQLVMQREGDTNFEVAYDEIYRGLKSENVLDFEKCAEDCGLGEIGLSGSILTDDFGPNQRWGFILTDAELPPDEPAEPHLCDRCGECVKACPGHALNQEGKRDSWQCAAYYKGANRTKNPFMPANAFADDPERLKIIAGEAHLTPERAREIIDQIRFYPPIKHAMVASMCGRACDTACYVHLEEKGVLKRKFNTPFRKRPVWSLPLDDEKKRIKMDFKGNQDICSLPNVKLVRGKGGLPFVKIANRHAEAEICLMGGHIVSYVPAGEKAVLWMSEKSRYQAGEELRGGIPICWPWFGASPEEGLPPHGFARISDWDLESVHELADGATRILLSLEPEKKPVPMAKWPFRLELAVTVGSELETVLTMYNHSAEPQRITAALHNYFAVSDIRQVRIHGLNGTRYIDKTRHAGNAGGNLQRGDIVFQGETVRVYAPVSAAVEIRDPVWDRTVVIEKSGSLATAVWNPWIEKARELPDYGDEEYRQMVCVESANTLDDARTLLPGVPHVLGQKIRIRHRQDKDE